VKLWGVCGHLMPYACFLVKTSKRIFVNHYVYLSIKTDIDIKRGVSKGLEDGCKAPAPRESYPLNNLMAVSEVACPQGAKGYSMTAHDVIDVP
jgi:hypothetical protein